ncbi:MAG: hypothetical protein IJX06_01135 [Clostridia bacterium]|nr:hypothetical protein [Clostridia bacterium]
MKRLGYKYHLVSIMMIISLICIGFSSWNITNQIGGQSLTGSIKADNVINSSEYIDFDTSADADDTKDGLEIFDYCADGFIVQNTISKTATLKAHYVIKLDYCKTTFKDYTSLKVVITLRGTNGGNAMSIFTKLAGTTVNASIFNDGGISADGVSNKDPELYTYTINFSNILSSDLTEYRFSVIYTFNVENFSLFYAQINNNPEFFISARITGVN